MRIVNPIAVLGENYAVELLKKKGYRIVERNFRKRYGEIDIIAVKNKTLVFVEVKTRKSSRFGTPLEAITQRKIHELINTAQFYKLIHQELPESMRIDAISVSLNSQNEIDRIEHVENIT